MDVPFNPIYDIPATFKSKICLCDNPVVDPFHKHPILVWCQRCSKPLRWQLRICSSCKELYIADFRNPENCKYVQHQRCWTCLQNPDTKKCEDSCSYRTEVLVVPPVGLNPKKYTKEEIDEAMKELGLDL
jgi:hypothetical protein